LLPSGAPESVSNMLPTKRASGPRAACARRSSYEHLSVIREVGERAAVQETDGHVPAAIAENPSHREPRCLPQGDGGSPTSDSSIARPISGPCTSLGVRGVSLQRQVAACPVIVLDVAAVNAARVLLVQALAPSVVAARFSTQPFTSFLQEPRNHQQRGHWVGPPPVKRSVRAQSEQERERQVRARQRFLRFCPK
jgi:hypothetical protein